MSNTNDLLNRINNCYSSMSKGQKLLATYITDNYDKAVFLTAAKMGETVGVSESTVVRFATYLGYKAEFYSEDGSDLRKNQPVEDFRDSFIGRRGQDQNDTGKN